MVSAVRNETFATSQTRLCFFFEQFCTKHLVQRQHTPQEVIAVDSTAGNGLHARVFISVVEQQAVSVSVVTAAFQKRVDTFGLFRGDAYYNSNPSFAFVTSGS